jgi:hypothetical protein
MAPLLTCQHIYTRLLGLCLEAWLDKRLINLDKGGQGFRQGGMGIRPPPLKWLGDIPINLIFWGKRFLVFKFKNKLFLCPLQIHFWRKTWCVVVQKVHITYTFHWAEKNNDIHSNILFFNLSILLATNHGFQTIIKTEISAANKSLWCNPKNRTN